MAHLTTDEDGVVGVDFGKKSLLPPISPLFEAQKPVAPEEFDGTTSDEESGSESGSSYSSYTDVTQTASDAPSSLNPLDKLKASVFSRKKLAPLSDQKDRTRRHNPDSDKTVTFRADNAPLHFQKTTDRLAKMAEEQKDFARHDIGTATNFAMFYGRLRGVVTVHQERIFNAFDLVVLNALQVDKACELSMLRPRRNAFLSRIPFVRRITDIEGDDAAAAAASGPALGIGTDIAASFLKGFGAARSLEEQSDEVGRAIEAQFIRGFDGVLIDGVAEACGRWDFTRIQGVFVRAINHFKAGEYIDRGEAAASPGGGDAAESTLDKEVLPAPTEKNLEKRRNFMIVLDCDDVVAVPIDFLNMILRLRLSINGVMLKGFTVNPNSREGLARLPYELKKIEFFIQGLKDEIQERTDFGVLAVEVFSARDRVSPELPTRFQRFCQENNFLGFLSSDPTHSDAASVTVLGGITPNAILDSAPLQQFMNSFESVVDAPFGSERYSRLVRALGYRLADATRNFEFDPVNGDTPTLIELGNYVDTLKHAFFTRLGQVPASEGGKQIRWGTEAHAAWLSVCATAFSRIRDDNDQLHPLSEVASYFSQLEKRALERTDDDRRTIDDDDSDAEDHDPEFIEAQAAQEQYEKEKARDDVIAYETTGKFLASIKRSRTISQAPKVGQEASTDEAEASTGSHKSGQKEFGYRHRLSQYSHVVQIQHDLRLGRLLGNLSKPVMREVYDATSENSNKMEMLPDSRFQEAVARIDAVVAAGMGSPKNQHILNAFKRDPRAYTCPLITMMKTLSTHMKMSSKSNPDIMQVQLWESDPAGMKFVSADGRETRWEAVSEKDGDVLHIYICKRHANIAEAVVHQYMQSCGLSNTQCVIAEALVRTHEKKVGKHEILGAGDVQGEPDKQVLKCVSDRILAQLERSSVRELMGFIQRTRKQELILLRRTDVSVDQRELALRVAKEIGAAAHERLLQVSQDNADNRAEIHALSTPLKMPERSEMLRYDLAALMREAAWRNPRLSQLQAIMLVMNAGMDFLKTKSNAHGAVRQAIMTFGRDAGLAQLELMVRDVTPFIVNEVDLCTVYIEMGGMTDGDIRRMFRLGKHDIGNALYQRIRKRMVAEEAVHMTNPDTFEEVMNIEGGPPPNPYDQAVSEALSNREYIKKFIDGLFFMFPFFINLLLVLTLKTGVFTSSYMSQAHQNLSGIAIVVAFVSVGGINSCIARTGSYYLYQWSFAPMLVVLTKLLWAGMLVVTINTVITAAVALAFFGWVDVAVYFGYTLLFGLLQLLIACLYNSHKGSIWLSREGITIMISIIIATAVVLLLLFVVQLPAIICHFVSLGSAVLFLLIAYMYLVHASSILYDGVKASTDVDVMDWFHRKMNGPPCPPTKAASQSAKDQALREWLAAQRGLDAASPECQSAKFLRLAKKEAVATLREARAAFAVAVMEARRLDKKAQAALSESDSLIQTRAMHYLAEESLVHWYVLLSAKTRPFPCTSEWDVVLKEAIKAMGIKTRTDILHRGGILWDMCRAYAVHGSFYFALMFVDRVLRIFSGSVAAFFVPTTPYELGVGWAQVFLLLAVGSLEPLIYRKSAALENCEHLRVGHKVSLGRMLRARSRQHRMVFLRELFLCFRFTVLAAAVATGFLLFFTGGIDYDVIWIFVVSCLGYIGFLVGGFNMLFLGGQQQNASRAIVYGLIAGLVAGGLAMSLTEAFAVDFAAWGLTRTTYADLACLGILFGGGTYGWYSIPRPGKDDKMSPTYDFASKAPLMTTAMQTSGQKWFQAPSPPPENSFNEGEIQSRDRFDAGLIQLTDRLSHMKAAVGVSAETGAGKSAATLLKHAMERIKRESPKSLIRRAFPEASEQVKTAFERWRDGRTEILAVSNKYLLLPGGDGTSVFSSIGRLETAENGANVLQIFVGVDSTKPLESHDMQIAEALIHETFEHVFKVSHAYAVAAELLLQKDFCQVPARIQSELAATSDKNLWRVDERSDDEVLAHSLINLSQNAIDHQWYRLTDETKALVAGLLARINPNFVSPALTAAQVRAHLHMNAKAYRLAVAQLTGDPPLKDLWERRLALAQLSCRLAVAIKHAAREVLNQRHVQRSAQYHPIDFRCPTGEYWDPYDTKGGRQELMTKKSREKASFGQRFLQKVDSVFRLFALAVVADGSYQAEKHFASHAASEDGGLGLLCWIVRFIMTPIYILSLHVIEPLIWLPLRWWRPHVRVLYEQLEAGLNRTRALRSSGAIDRIVRQDPENAATGFLQYDDEEDEIPTKTTRARSVQIYSGVLKTPTPNFKNRIALCEYAGGRLDRRYVTAGAKVKSTNYYSYESPHTGQTLKKFFIPVEKRDYRGEVTDEEKVATDDIQMVSYFDENGRVTAADIFRIDPASRKKLKINVVFIHPSKTNPADSRAHEHIFTVEGILSGDEVIPMKDDDKPFHSLHVHYHEFTSFVSEVEFRRTEVSEPLCTKYVYRHVSHPELNTVIMSNKGKRKHETPVFVVEDPLKLIAMLPATSIFEEDFLATLPKQKVKKGVTWFQRLVGVKGDRTEYVYTSPYSTRKARTVLWRAWQLGQLEGVYAQLLDERILRKERSLKPYWRWRTLGAVKLARKYILKNEGSIAPIISFPGSTTSHLILRVPDLLSFGPGGSSHHNGTLREIGGRLEESDDEELSESDTSAFGSSDDESDEDVEDEDSLFASAAVVENNHQPLHFSKDSPLQLLGVDSGTWPADGGGVASCRRDVINRLPRCRWLECAEVGSPMKLVQGSYQIEKNVQSLTFVPLWGTEVGGPNQTVLSNVPYGKLAGKRWRTTPRAIGRYFVPILTQLANASVLKERTVDELDHATALFVNMYLYFQRYDWSATWESPIVHEAWRRAWLHITDNRLKLYKKAQQSPDVDEEEFRPLQRELPTLEDIDFALSLIMHFLMPITVPLPNGVPVVHASHHGIQAVIGAVARHVNGSAFCVWDHGVLWRERVLALSELKTFPLFVRNILVGITRVCVAVVFHNCDAVVPCCSTNNPQWEARLGGHNNNQQETDMWRRISPVINGMETDRFHCHREDEPENPTAVMLSHVYDLKDVKNAIRAADIIVNKFKLSVYRLMIYGSLDKDLEYVDECRAIIADNGLAANVFLCGLGNAPAVLPKAWLFLNSSKSEGLPLALGEAGLCGMPVVCTDVGGSREVVTDHGQECGAVTPARNAQALAEGQLRVFAMLGNLQLAGAEPHEQAALRESKELTLDDFKPVNPNGMDLLPRMQEMTPYRRRLGMRFRAYILSAFTMARYLREHEEIMWIAAKRSRERLAAGDQSDRGDAFIDMTQDIPASKGSSNLTQRRNSVGGVRGGSGRRQSISRKSRDSASSQEGLMGAQETKNGGGGHRRNLTLGGWKVSKE